MDGEGAPLRGGGMEVAVLHVQVARADRLRPEPVEQRHLGTAGDTHCRVGQTGTSGHREATNTHGARFRENDIHHTLCSSAYHQHHIIYSISMGSWIRSGLDQD